MQNDVPPGLEAFWALADDEALDDHPLERELCERLDTLARYRTMLFEASAAGRDEAVAALQRAHDREVKLVRDLRRALSNMR
ncbi:MAG: hypothetical protein ACYC28_08120 [Longimicrobiales bacterium]